MAEESSYLSKLKFDRKLLSSLVAKYITNLRIVILILLTIIAFGIQSYLSLPRKLNPEIKIPIVVVATVLPGANPQDIESLVTIPLEDAVRGVANVKTVTSSSRESLSIIRVEFNSGVDPEKAKSDISSAVDGVKTLPSDAQKPVVQKFDFENQPIWVFNLTGAGDDRASLIRFARILKKDLEDLPNIDKVLISGIDEQEIQIVIKPEVVSSYSFNPQLLLGSIKTALLSLPAGSVKTDRSTFSLSINPEITQIEDVRNLRVNLGGNVFSLGEIAQVKEISKPEQKDSHILVGNSIKPTITFNVFRLTTVNFDRANADAKKLVDQRLTEQNGRFQIHTVLNAAEQIEKQFNDLQKDIFITVVLVFAILLIFLGIRQAVISMLSIPLTFLITFIVMQMTGIALSFIASFSLLLSLGLLVDDTIVVISAMTAYYRSGKFTPLQTALLVWKDFWVAILTTTITTVWAFIPLLLSTGIIGEFIKPIPIVVSSTLLASLFVALFITLPLMVFLLKMAVPFRVRVLLNVLVLLAVLGAFYLLIPKNSLLILQLFAFVIFILVTYQVRRFLADWLIKRFIFFKYMNNGFVSFQRLERAYLRLIRRILSSKSARRNAVIMVVIFSVFSYLLVPTGLVKSEFFPKTDEDNLYISVELPAGTNLEITKEKSLKILEQLKGTPETKFVTLDLGRSYSAMEGPSEGESNTFLYSLALEEREKRHKNSSDIAQEIRNKFADFNEGKFSVIEVSGGPPAGADLQIKLFGPDLRVLDQYANKIMDHLSKQKGVTNVDKTIKAGTSKFVFVPDKQKLTQNGIGLDNLGFWLRLYASGFKADEFKFSGDESLTEDVTIRLGSDTQYIENLSKVSIPTPSGIVPLSSLGALELQPNPTLITREDGKRTISVTASVTKGYTVSDLNKQLENFASTLDLPSGYGWATGGANEENQRSVNSIISAMGLSFLLIITTMVLQFRSFRRAFIVMLVIPLSISGVFIIFALTQTPLSFPALIGILALFGIVVKNSILVVDKILINQRTGMEFANSIADAAASRLEPIALTSMAAIAGLIPITISNPLWRGLGGAIIAGLTFSGTIMLFFIPVVYFMIFNPYKNTSKK